MKLSIKDLSISMELKNRGIEIEVRDTKDCFLGDLIINKAGMVWCKGKQQKQNGAKKSWNEIIDFFTDNKTE